MSKRRSEIMAWLREEARVCEAAEDPNEECYEMLHEAANEIEALETRGRAAAGEQTRGSGTAGTASRKDWVSIIGADGPQGAGVGGVRILSQRAAAPAWRDLPRWQAGPSKGGHPLGVGGTAFGLRFSGSS
jgi:hypothetical protein